MAREPLVVPRRFQQGLRRDEEALDSARRMIRDLIAELGLPDLGALTILDVGCGVKITQALLNDDLPVGRYVGVDVNRPMIEFLQAHVTDERFEFHPVPFRNELYNPDGELMTADSKLPVPEHFFDLIVLHSVFTHLNPTDYVAMLTVLRRHVKPSGRVVYSLFLDRLSSTGVGFMDALSRKLPRAPGRTVDFRDWSPDKPMKYALYTEEHARALIEGTGWRFERMIEPTPDVQHQFVLVPEPDAGG